MSNVRICLDAGHVGSRYNQSPVVKTYYESAMVWKLHLKLKAQLEARGFQVVTTRASIDTDLGVYERGTASKGCDVFISLHSNACGTESVDYPVVYRAYDNKNNVDTLALKLAKKVGELMGTTQAGRTATRKNSSGGEYYGVLRGARAVGTPYYMLIEHSFHTNTKATKWLSEDANLDKLAVAEADILAEFFGMESSTETEKTAIMGKAQATASQMAAFCLSKNASPQLPSCTVEELARMFIEEGEAEGVRGDVAFAQSLHETGYFKFGGIVLPSQNNYAGIGALNGNAAGQAASFPDPRTGVRAQIQHLKAYASTEALVNECVDPRFSLVVRGVAPYVEWLGAADNPNGKGWAVPGKGYGEKVTALLEQILRTEDPSSPAAGTPEPAWAKLVAGYPQYQKDGLEALAEADIAEVERYIHSTGFFRAKAKDIVLASQMLLRDYGGRVPDTMEELLKLPGVGRKTANLILGDVYHTPGVVVADTHCIRISGLLGLTDGTKDPGKVEQQLRAILPPEESNDFCHRLVLHGRAVCIARRPQCQSCTLRPWCDYFMKNGEEETP